MTENKQYIHECIQRDRLDDIIEQLRSIENKLHGVNGNNGLFGRVVKLEQQTNYVRVWVERFIVALLSSTFAFVWQRIVERV